ncbi:MAG: response regulator, partial [Deltaproteobacteria bacterium]
MEQTAELSPTSKTLVFPKAARSHENKNMELSSYRVLIVEDEPSLLELMLPLLQRRLPMVDTASDGRQAQKLIQQAKYNLVLTDLHMPNVDGMALLSWVKKLQPEVDVILMSGELSPEAEQEARQKGAADFLTKPFSSKKLLEAIDRCRSKRTTSTSRAIDPTAFLLKPLIYDLAAGLENAATMLKLSQKACQGSGAESLTTQLESVNANLFKLMGLTEDYCSLLLCLDQKGEIPTGRYDLQADTIEVVLKELASEIR